jgi:hypothetical protein
MAGLGDGATSAARLYWFVEPDQRQRIGRLLVDATTSLIADAAQSESNYAWFRQDWDVIQRRRDGITIDAAGLSDLTGAAAKLLPAQSRDATDSAWLAATRDSHTKTAAGYGIVAVGDADDHSQQLQAGRLLERIHLAATAGGVALHHMNQLTERADRERQLGIAPQFGDALRELLPAGVHALSTFRVGYPTHTPRKSPRRRAESMITS